MKRYKLKKDLPTFKAGDEFELKGDGLYLCSVDPALGHWKMEVMAYHRKTLEAFPNILDEWFEEIESPGAWKPKQNDEYWFIDAMGRAAKTVWDDTYPLDGQCAEFGNVFRTKKEAEKAIEWLKAFKVLSEDAGDSKPLPATYHYEVVYQAVGAGGWRLEVADWLTHLNSPLRFSRLMDAKESIRKHHKEWLTFFGIEKES